MTEQLEHPGGSRLLRGVARSSAKMRADFPLALLDTVLIGGGYGAALLLRFDGAVPAGYWAGFLTFIPVAVLVHLAANGVAGLYGQVWLHASVREARQVLVAAALAAAVLGAIFLPGQRTVPASVIILGAALAPMLIGMLRFQSRLFYVHRRGLAQPRQRVVLVGAGNAGAALIADMLRNREEGFVPVAAVDDDPRKRGRDVGSIPVAGSVAELASVVRQFGADQVLLAVPSADRSLVRRVADEADAASVPVKVLPAVSERMRSIGVRDVRDLAIEDLLGREQVGSDLAAVGRMLRGRRVLITGAGGSIGSEIARQVAGFEPSSLVILDHDETHLHEALASIGGRATPVLADIRDEALVDRLFDVHRPEVVFHAAAHKHVPLLETHPCEAVATNVGGTRNIAASAAKYAVERFLFISTDKAVKPRSVMGASKRLGEQIVRSYAPPTGHWCAVRFGNVLGSRGSVIPTFVRQIRQGGPVTVTHPDVTRFFMSIEEAVELVLQASVFAKGGELFMLDMGEPLKILELAERMIRLSGHQVGSEIEIAITGMRPGEKLTEELWHSEENPRPTPHPSIVALDPAIIRLSVVEELGTLLERARGRDDYSVREHLFKLVGAPEAHPDDAIAAPDPAGLESHPAQ